MRNKKARVPDPNEFFSNPGERYHIEYTSKVLPDGTIELVESGKMDIQEYIESFKESTDMHYILSELQKGNVSVLDQRTPSYGDFTEAPGSMAEFQQRLIDGERAFMQLPLDVRNAYDNDLWQWMNDTGSEKWMKVMSDFLPHPVEDVKSEVVEDA